jgi:acyl-CoA thioester hydrolase
MICNNLKIYLKNENPMLLLSTTEHSIRWTDLDAYGHVNNSKFFDFMTEARAIWLKDLLKIEGLCQFVTAHVECDYKAPYHYPDTVILKQFCEEKGKTKFVLHYEFYSEGSSGVLHAHAKAVMVAYDPVAKRPARLPQEVLALLDTEMVS